MEEKENLALIDELRSTIKYLEDYIQKLHKEIADLKDHILELDGCVRGGSGQLF